MFHPCSSVAAKKYRLKHHRLALGHQKDLFLDSVRARGCKQSLRGFVEGFEAEGKTPVMHRDQSARAQFEESFYRLLRIHVNFAAGGGVICPNGKQRQLDVKAITNFSEAWEIGSVAAVKNLYGHS